MNNVKTWPMKSARMSRFQSSVKKNARSLLKKSASMLWNRYRILHQFFFHSHCGRIFLLKLKSSFIDLQRGDIPELHDGRNSGFEASYRSRMCRQNHSRMFDHLRKRVHGVEGQLVPAVRVQEGSEERLSRSCRQRLSRCCKDCD